MSQLYFKKSFFQNILDLLHLDIRGYEKIICLVVLRKDSPFITKYSMLHILQFHFHFFQKKNETSASTNPSPPPPRQLSGANKTRE